MENSLLNALFDKAARTRTEGGRDTVLEFWARSDDPAALDKMRAEVAQGSLDIRSQGELDAVRRLSGQIHGDGRNTRIGKRIHQQVLKPFLSGPLLARILYGVIIDRLKYS